MILRLPVLVLLLTLSLLLSVDSSHALLAGYKGRGWIDFVYSQDGRVYIQGWACEFGNQQSPALHLYVDRNGNGQMDYTGDFLMASDASNTVWWNDPGLHQGEHCGAAGQYRFRIDITPWWRDAYQKALRLHVITPNDGRRNPAINRSDCLHGIAPQWGNDVGLSVGCVFDWANWDWARAGSISPSGQWDEQYLNWAVRWAPTLFPGKTLRLFLRSGQVYWANSSIQVVQPNVQIIGTEYDSSAPCHELNPGQFGSLPAHQVVPRRNHYCPTIAAGDHLWGPIMEVFTDNVHVLRIVFDGRKESRTRVHNFAYRGISSNLMFWNSSNSSVQLSSFIKGYGGTSLGWSRGSNITIANNLVGWNGSLRQFSDGITVDIVNGGQVSNNLIIDNTDVDLIFFGGRNLRVTHNRILHTGDRQLDDPYHSKSIVAFMFDNTHFRSPGQPLPDGLGNFTGTVAEYNTVDCNVRRVPGLYGCDFAGAIGHYFLQSHYPNSQDPWPHIFGLTFRNNSLNWGRQGIVVAGAGTHTHPVTLANNAVTNWAPSPSGGFGLWFGASPQKPFNSFGCPDGRHATSSGNLDPGSTVVDIPASQRGGWTSFAWRDCF